MTRAMALGLPRPRNAEQGLRLHASVEAGHELLYKKRLVACRLVFAVYPEPVPRRFLGTRTSDIWWVVKRRGSGTDCLIILRKRVFSRSFYASMAATC